MMALRLLLLMSALGVTHLPVVTCPEEENRLHQCQEVDHEDLSSNVPCMVRSETFFNGSDATREMDICMGLPQLMNVLNNSQNMQLKNVDLTIANGEVIVDDDQATGFRERWRIAITAEVDQKHGLLLRYKVTVRNPDSNDEYHFRLVFIIDGLSFSTESKIWFPTSGQQNATPSSINPVLADPTTEPATRPASTRTTATPLDSECVSLLEFHEAINHTNDMIAELKQSSWCDWKCGLRITADIAVLAVSIVFLLLKTPLMIMACKYVYQKIISARSKFTAIPQDDPDHASLNQVTTSGSQQGAQQDVDQNLQITADVQD